MNILQNTILSWKFYTNYKFTTNPSKMLNLNNNNTRTAKKWLMFEDDLLKFFFTAISRSLSLSLLLIDCRLLLNNFHDQFILCLPCLLSFELMREFYHFLIKHFAQYVMISWRSLTWLQDIYTISLYITIYKDTVPWPIYICTI